MGYLDFTFFDEVLLDSTRAVFWHAKTVDLFITYGDSPKALSGSISKFVGTMKALPEWTFNGAIIGL